MGLLIYAPVHRMSGVKLAEGMPKEPMHIFDMTSIACERWVQFSPEGWDEMQEANACLIVAAPDMLAACKWAEAVLAPFSKEPAEKAGINLLRAAIAKAEGRGGKSVESANESKKDE